MKTWQFNSSEYAFKDLEVLQLGRPIVRLLNIKYKVDHEKEPIYGRGDEPLQIQRGNKKYSGELEIGQSELEAMIINAKKNVKGEGYIGVTDLPPFDISICYNKNGVLVRDIVRSVDITEVEKGMKQGDKDMICKLPFISLGIDFNIDI